MSIISAIKKRMTPTSLKVAGVVALVALTAGVGFATKSVASAQVARDCSVNSIDYKNLNGGCGALSPSEFIKDVKNNNPNDLQTVYSDFGLVPSSYGNFVSNAEMGQDDRNGNIVVNGQVVATNTWSIGRQQIAGETPIKIGGHTYYRGSNQVSYGKGVESIPVMVMFNSDGVMQFAVMTACGNSVGGSKVTPTYTCKALNETHVSGDTYKFTTDASAANNASIEKVVYDFGDGSATVTENSPSTPVTHTFTKSSTVTVKVYVKLPGNQTKIVESDACSKHITVTPPPPPAKLTCVNLNLVPGTVDSQTGDTDYTLTATASAQNATITGYTFDFGDGSSKPVNTSNTSASVSHTYAPGTWTAKVTVNGSNNLKSSCTKMITVTPAPGSLVCCGLNIQPGTISADGSEEFTLKASADTSAQNATIDSYTFNLGGSFGTKTVTTSAKTATTSFTYPAGTDVTVTVTVTGTVNGKSFTTPVSQKCSKEIKVPAQKASSIVCEDLAYSAGTADSQGNIPYTFTVDAVPTNATIDSYVFSFAPNTPQTSNTATNSYAPGANVNVSVTVNGTLANGNKVQVTSANCAVQFTVPSTPTCTSVTGQTFPQGSSQCQTCTSPSGQTFQLGSPECNQTPTPSTSLPNTGPGDVVGLFSGVSMSGAGIHRIIGNRRARRAAARR